MEKENLVIESNNKKEKPIHIGFGGWLYFVAFSLIIVCGKSALNLLEIYLPLLQSGMVAEASKEEPLLGVLIIFEIIFTIFFILFPIYLGVLCYQQKKSFRKMMILYFSISFALNALYYFLLMIVPNIELSQIKSQETIVISALIYGTIWTLYFIKSKRVNDTYVL